MSMLCGPEYRQVLIDTLGVDGVAQAEREAAFFFANEILAVGGWAFDERTASRVEPPVLLVQGGASPPVLHRLVARLAGLFPQAEVATIEGEIHLLPLRSAEAFGDLVAKFAARNS